ncbi:MAG: 30S ribosome-binding factor RbfA [Pirellulales bacterium]
MASRRMLKAAEAIREVVSMAILTEIRDPRVKNVTVTGVEITPDMRSAKVLISVMGDEVKQNLCIRGLANSAGFLQSKIAKRIETRYTPRLSFELDLGVKKSLEVGQILADIAREREELAARREAEQSDSEPTTDKVDHD